MQQHIEHKTLIEEYAIRTSKVIVYRQFIDQCEFPEEMDKLLDTYLKGGDSEIETVIETQYDISVVKEANFRAGQMYYSMKSPLSKLREQCMANGFNWTLIKIGFVATLIVVGFLLHNGLRYQYKTYKGNYNYIQVVRIDRLTGESVVYYPKVIKNKN